MPNPDHCPANPEETAEAYLLGKLPADEARAFENHYITCPKCAAILRQTDKYVVAGRRATERLRRSQKAS
jgi:anti-sigma factor RsiW